MNPYFPNSKNSASSLPKDNSSEGFKSPKKLQRDNQKSTDKVERKFQRTIKLEKELNIKPQPTETVRTFKKQIQTKQEVNETNEDTKKTISSSPYANRTKNPQKPPQNDFLDNLIRPVQKTGRYGSKKEPTIPLQTQQTPQKQIKTEIKKYPQILCSSLVKMLMNKKYSFWATWKQKVTSKTNSNYLYLSKLMNSLFFSSYQRNQQIFFSQLKHLSSKEIKKQINQLNKLSNSTLKCCHELLPKIFLFFETKDKISAFRSLKNHSKKKKQASSAIMGLSKLEHRKLSLYFSILSSVHKPSKEQAAKKISKLVKLNHNWVKLKALKLMCRQNLMKSVEEQKTTVMRKTSSFSKVKDNSTKNLQNKINQISQQYRNEKQQLVIMLEQLKHRAQEQKYQIETKSKIKSDLKDTLDMMPQPASEDISLSEPQETKFSLIFEIYMQTFKSTQGEVIINTLIEDYPFLEDHSTKIVNEWNVFIENLQVKRRIQLYEGDQKNQRKAAKILNEEQKNLEDLIKNYVRQKYVWAWIRSCVATQ